MQEVVIPAEAGGPDSGLSTHYAAAAALLRTMASEHSSHNLHLDVPDLVIEGILSVVNEARVTRPQQQVKP